MTGVAIDNKSIPVVGMVHVDLDDIWALRDCYGFEIDDSQKHFMYTHTLPALSELLDESGIKATFFVIGKDLEYEQNVDILRTLIANGHFIGSHSWEHRLDWRNLDAQTMDKDLVKTERILQDKLGITPQGFRTPGYAYTPKTIDVLINRGYRYDSSLMPSPWGWVFRHADSKMMVGKHSNKTQFPVLKDVFHPLRPYHPTQGQSLIEFPVATAPFTRLPIQTGVCMRLGMPWLKMNLSLIKSLELPYIMLMHLTDLCDFQAFNHAFFLQQPFFARPVEEKTEFVRQALMLLKSKYPRVEPPETWL